MAEIILRCPKCGEVMIREKLGYWRCPRCGGEFWPDEERSRELAEAERARASVMAMRERVRWSVGGRCTEVPLLVPCYIRKSSSDKAGRKRKRERPPLLTERYIL